MKRFRALFFCYTFLFFLLAGGVIYFATRQSMVPSHAYRVEVKHEMEELTPQLFTMTKEQEIITLKELEATKAHTSNIRHIYFLPQEGAKKRNLVEAFYQPSNSTQIEIRPVWAHEELLGYLRFDYVTQAFPTSKLVWMIAILLLVYAMSLFLYWYIETQIRKPFESFLEMPYELAKGNLNWHVKECKARYFGRFLWGIEMLRDTLASQKRRELALEKEKKMLLLSLSHDIKTPLHAIMLYAKSLEAGLYEAGEKEAVYQRITEKTQEIDQYVTQIISSSTEEIVVITVNDGEYYLNDLIQKVTFGYEERARLEKMRFEIAPIQNQLLSGDMERMYEAMGNLIENAYKYGDGREISLSFSNEEDYLLIHVRNSGVPVEENELPHLLEGFYRGSNGKDKPGNGLGLYICREIMRKMQGDIYAKRQEEGMEFVLVCPLA